MPNTLQPRDVYQKFYWVYHNVRGAPHPDKFDWDVPYEDRRDIRQRVQMGWSPYNGPLRPSDCPHPYLERAWCSFAAKQERINYVICDRCGTVVHPNRNDPGDEAPFLCSS